VVPFSDGAELTGEVAAGKVDLVRWVQAGFFTAVEHFPEASVGIVEAAITEMSRRSVHAAIAGTQSAVPKGVAGVLCPLTGLPICGSVHSIQPYCIIHLDARLQSDKATGAAMTTRVKKMCGTGAANRKYV